MLTGVSGSGKSTLAHDVLYLALRRALGTARGHARRRTTRSSAPTSSPTSSSSTSRPIGRTPRANAATYVGAWDGIRALFAKHAARRRSAATRPPPSRSTCPAAAARRCKGDGHEKVEMQFLSDVYVPCPDCDGKRFRPEVCEVAWEGLDHRRRARA